MNHTTDKLYLEMKDRKHFNGVHKLKRFKFMVICFALLFIIQCATTPKIGKKIEPNRLNDGTYEAYFKGGLNAARVRVAIQNGKITDINILKHDAWKGKNAGQKIPDRIIKLQSTNVDAVSGATNSSHVIMNAVQKAIEKAYSNQKHPGNNEHIE